ncbi:hypothetical protein [Paracoccus sp. KR1-242]|uniref:hypothetical protein n=1 Tax=Paracoccus sp. KR1-242 TaxID=3410028 RepID=UPI003C0E6045
MTNEESLDPSIRAFLNRLTENEAAIRSLAPRPEFKSLCQDYAAALEASEIWCDKPEVAHQFWCIAMEIEDEIRLLLTASRTG